MEAQTVRREAGERSFAGAWAGTGGASGATAQARLERAPQGCRTSVSQGPQTFVSNVVEGVQAKMHKIKSKRV